MAYAAVVSLIHVVEQTLLRGQHFVISDQKKHLEALHEKMNHFHDFLDDTSLKRNEKVEHLEGKIRDSAYATEDILDSYFLQESDFVPGDEAYVTFCLNIQKMIQEIDSVTKELMEIKKDGNQIVAQTDVQPKASSNPAGPSSTDLSKEKKISTVGIDDDLLKLQELLTKDHSGVQIISITGMGGIGKTTLAQKVFNNPLIGQHFDVRAWVTVSQTYTIEKIVKSLFDSMNCKVEDWASEEKLLERLYKTLKDRRYFIVLDDIWDTVIWDKLKRFFPDDGMGSRVMLTTRLDSVAKYANSCMPFHHMGLLSMDVSWDLFCSKVFSGEESCPVELEELGKDIVKSCGGLPLAIVVMGGLISKVEKRIDSWNDIAKDVSLVADTKMEQCTNILSKSYKHLPHRFKACLLYMGIFPEDHEIKVSDLTKLWVDEGFLKNDESKSSEEVAEENLEELIQRNLIFTRKKKYGKMITCGIHDLLRDFCLAEADKEKFYYVHVDSFYGTSKEIGAYRRIIFHTMFTVGKETPKLAARTVLCFTSFPFSLEHISNVGQLRVYGGKMLNLKRIPGFFIEKMTNLTSLTLSCDGEEECFPLLFKLWNLQTLIIQGQWRMKSTPHLPDTMWNMLQLRHLQSNREFFLPEVDEERSGILENLCTLSTVSNFRCTEEVFRRIPNIKKLKINGLDYPTDVDWSYYCLENVVHLEKLEALRCNFVYRAHILRILVFPPSLKTLTLHCCGLFMGDMTILGSLPNLEVLRIVSPYLKPPYIWEPTEGEFCCLKWLSLENTYLKHLIADSASFPCLENLILKGCVELSEIPSGIGAIPTLEMIEISYCSDGVFDSAKKIAEEQRSNGNDGLQVRYKDSDKGLITIL